MIPVKITTEYIELQMLLKMQDIITSGGQAKYFLQENDVFVNGELENRRGKKLYPGDKIKVLNQEFIIQK
ncbi:MAG: S4 domain-containing protein YaaA [Acholeplasmatales bacterium]|nr:S4 domain-containing protein YaaA [Acholeplasmatales bacterium]